MKVCKRIFATILATAMSMSVVACKSDETQDTTTEKTVVTETTETTAPTETTEATTSAANGAVIYSYPEGSYFGLESISVYEDHVDVVFDQNTIDQSIPYIVKNSVEFGYCGLLVNPYTSKYVECDSQLVCENGKYVVSATAQSLDSNLSLTSCFAGLRLSSDGSNLEIEVDQTSTHVYSYEGFLTQTEEEQTFSSYRWSEKKERVWRPEPNCLGSGDIEIMVYAVSGEVPNMIVQFMNQNPDMEAKYIVKYMYCNNDGQGYETKLNKALQAGEGTAPDLYIAEADYIFPYTQGEFSQYAATYEDLLGADVMNRIKEAGIADYSVNLGTNADGKLVALAYQSTVGAFIYRRSIAKEVFGSDDPATVESAIGAGTQSWDKFLEAAETLKGKGYAIVSGLDDLYQVSDKACKTPWVVDGKFNIDKERTAYIDLAEKVIANDYSNDTASWGTDWYADMSDENERKVFGWFGPCWLINYVIAGQCEDKAAFGDYAVCKPNLGFWWGGSWLFANAQVLDDADKKEFCAKFIEWVTLDTSETGLPYNFANGTYAWTSAKDTVSSSVVLAKSNGTMDFLGGQDPFAIFIDATSFASSKCKCAYDADLNGFFQDTVSLYAHGKISKDDVMTKMYDLCEEKGIEVEE